MTEQTQTVIGRLSRHPLSDQALEILQSRFPEGIQVVELGDVSFGTTPRKNILNAVEAAGVQLDYMEVNAPISVLVDIVGKLGDIQMIQQVFDIDEHGRKVIVGQDEKGRDIFKPKGFKVITEIVVKEDPL